MALLDLIDINKAFRRVFKDKRDDPCPDIFGYRDVKQNLPEYLHLLEDTIINNPNNFRIRPLEIDIPKKGYTIRPGLVPHIDERIVYQGLADYLSTNFTPEENVFSNKLAPPESSLMFIQGVELWIKFQEKIAEHCGRYNFVIETDLTSYFEHINHDVLTSKIRNLFYPTSGNDEIAIINNCLLSLLGNWSVNSFSKFGIPQVNDPSSFFSNVYLDDLDKWFLSNGIIALRYVDDIRVFAEDEPTARKYLTELIRKLRSMGLYLNSGKTKIKKSTDVIYELERGRKTIDSIELLIETREKANLEIACGQLTNFFLGLIETQDNFNDRQFRFCINRFKKLHISNIQIDVKEQIVSEILSRLWLMPESTDVFIDYLSLFQDDENIQENILSYISSNQILYPWQEMLLFELLIRLNLAPRFRINAIQLANRVVNNNYHPACRSKALIFIGKNGSYADRRNLRGVYFNEYSDSTKKSIIMAIQEMEKRERNYFFDRISGESVSIWRAVSYIKQLREPTYHYFKLPQPYEVTDEMYDSDDLFDLGSEYFI